MTMQRYDESEEPMSVKEEEYREWQNIVGKCRESKAFKLGYLIGF